MAIISQETWDNFLQEEKEKIIKDYNNSADAVRIRLEAYFGKENLKPKPKIRTWEDIENMYDKDEYDFNFIYKPHVIYIPDELNLEDKLSNKCVATAKIAKLIELGYGGMVTKEENVDLNKPKFIITPVEKSDGYLDWEIYSVSFAVDKTTAFRSLAQAKIFMTFPKNRELLKQYYMI